jgi:tetratricopeptide (TPR) repeat protein
MNGINEKADMNYGQFPRTKERGLMSRVCFASSCGFANIAFAVLVLLVACTSVTAQMTMACHDMGMTTKEISPPDELPVPIKFSGIGNSHISITASSDAKIWFDQGLNLLHDFWEYEAERAFQQSIRVDPQCAMCYWGLYQSLIMRHSLGSGYADQALASAVRLKDHATRPEQLYIQAAGATNDALKATGPESHTDDKKEIAVWRQLVQENPNDIQAKIFLANAARDGYDETGEPNKGTKETISLLQGILKIAPNDSAANHYWIHAIEATNHPEMAIGSAALLPSLAPSSGHMVHMPGHIYYRIGDYASAEHWFAVSTSVDENYMRTQHVDIDDDWNYVHNLMYGVANLLEEGKFVEAAVLSTKLTGARGQLSETLYIQSARDSISRIEPQLPVALRFGDWSQVITLINSKQPDTRLQNLVFLAGQLKQFAIGMQAAQSGDLATAQASSTSLDSELWRLTQKVKDTPPKPKANAKTTIPFMAAVRPDAQAPPLLSALSVMSLELRASILAEKKQITAAKKLFDQAAQEEKDLGYHEPPLYIRPVGETEGLVLLQAGDFSGAHAAYQAALAERPNSGFGLYGMARSSEAAGDITTARTEYAEFMDAWKNSDPENPEMTHARNVIASSKPIIASAVSAN